MSLLEREKRVPLNLPVEVRGEDVAGVHFTEQTRSHNVSGGGICFESQRQLVVGSELTLTIQVPEALRKRFGDRAIYRARAVICRVERFEGQPMARVGARFLGEASSAR